MRATVAVAVTILTISAALAGCGESAKTRAKEADAKAAGFVPPMVLSRLDYGGVVERRFHALDRNGDEAISADELPTADSRLMRLDRNGDGKITASEWSEGMLGRFDRMDANHDGSLTSEERDAFRAGH